MPAAGGGCCAGGAMLAVVLADEEGDIAAVGELPAGGACKSIAMSVD